MIQNRMFIERRKNPRLEGNVPVKISCPDYDIVTETKNLSRAGAYCRIEQYIEPMTKLKLQLLLPFRKHDKAQMKKILCQGVVVRVESVPNNNYYNIAIYFNDIHGRDSEFIAEYINAMIDKQKEAPAAE